MDHPLITGGGQMLRSYQIGSYKSVLVKSPESVGPIKYLYVMIVFSGNGTEPVLFVTAERNEMQGELLKIAAGQTGNPNLGSEDNGYFLGVFSKDGRFNLGASRDWEDQEKFEKKAIEIVRERLRVADDARIVTQHKKDEDQRAKASNPVGFDAGQFPNLTRALFGLPTWARHIRTVNNVNVAVAVLLAVILATNKSLGSGVVYAGLFFGLRMVSAKVGDTMSRSVGMLNALLAVTGFMVLVNAFLLLYFFGMLKLR